ncbi:concanavalin A-like lectin/glucanase [Zopfia rhizophila CBS 207.26]|uniref:Concanavalin A-like lectin/glucanase n=1 Tax=Zopfia rhizophila CBS 207.26 TaxID=1314779 RepID=A0A6A6EWV1_9PEZI|nr:concanavalin A-like lectin/glucanase [Zopfia rhizophila CBS 207.26]
MYIGSQTLRTIAWSAFALSAARAQYTIDNLSFGHRDGPLSPNMRGVPHWYANGDGYTPEILSDRVILTPPYPGMKRGSLWTEDVLNHEEWAAELSFRATGLDRGGGNLQVWYVKDNQKDQTPSSLYTASPFDGLVLLIDQYEGRGGSIRGFLNDGTIDFKSHHSPDTLSFGQCDHPYRNHGMLTVLRLRQIHGVLEVTVDGHPCFKTDKVKLPTGYYFGLSASSAENPDSFEVHKFIVSTANTIGSEEPHYQRYHPEHEPQQQAMHQQDQGRDQQKEPSLGEIPQMLSDVLAGSIRSQQDQFADLHNRIQIINHRVNDIYHMLERLESKSEERFLDVMHRVVPVDDRTNAMMRNVEKVERISMEVQRDLESKDFKEMLNVVHRAIEDSHNALSGQMPLAMAHIVGSHQPKMHTFLFLAIVVQVLIVGAYLVYKKKKLTPKKYL